MELRLHAFSVDGRVAPLARRAEEWGTRSLGLERIVVVPGSLDVAPERVQEITAAFARDVIPALAD
jgi:hypothetical protein